MTTTIWAETALTADGWADAVKVEIGDDGNIAAVKRDQPQGEGERIEILLPALANVHSHAHQRAMAGLGERAGTNTEDSFWTWRQAMYHYLARIQPDDLYHIAAQLYVEMLKAGYACVGEFQYLHHDLNGAAYANRAEMSLQCLHAARAVGIGFTALPVLYRYGGFGNREADDGQQRFINDAAGFSEIVTAIQRDCSGDPDSTVGIAPHSLRAVDQALLGEVFDNLNDLAAIHIHIAEQSREVDDCVAWSGRRPVQWLFDHFDVNADWCLIHATHMDAGEIRQLAQSGAVAGLCPTTEANLGDGFFDADDYFTAGGRWAIGSDSHISVEPVEELRWLEYGQRLRQRRRNLLTSRQRPNTGRNLLDGAYAGGAQACARAGGRIEVGARADLITIDAAHPRLYGRKADEIVDSWIFSGNAQLVRDVYVGGQRRITGGRHTDEAVVAQNFRATVDRLAN